MNKLLTITFAVMLFMTFTAQATEKIEKTVFVTSATYDSNLGGLAGADAQCQAEADDPASIVPSGTYLAWLSAGTDSPDTRFTKSSHPYLLPDGTKIAENYIDLTDGTILNTINIDATGKSVGHQQYWTGTDADGTSYGDKNTCGDWGDNPASYVYGMTGHTANKTTSWSTYRGYPCSRTFRLACFQQ
jgi:hypothetical protein